ncbi:MAG: metalloregulator ArsR/SmtB family transcription factor [Firmicutes bacterium]|nr:metalloregulator ArsR/SmtB family transcription factor [Bacillota bacterium]
MSYNYSEFMPIIKAISDETRLKIIDMLSCGEMCANEILEKFELSQSTLSYHMKILTDAGIVQGIREGAWMKYTLKKKEIDEMINFIRYITDDKDNCICKENNHGEK